MHISKFQVFNYKSYNDSTEIELKSGFNIITGQNNAGKTALLDALTLNFPARPHRSESTVPFRGAPVEQASSMRSTTDEPALIVLSVPLWNCMTGPGASALTDL